MQFIPLRLILLRVPILLLILALAACSGGSRLAAVPDSPSPGTPAGGIAIDDLAGDLAAAEVPAGVDPAVFRQLTGELVRVLRATGQSRFASAPPAGERNAVRDLALVGSDSLGYALEWTYVSTGDYDLNGEVNVSDLTPIGQSFGAREGDPYWEDNRNVDGDGNGEINVSDITPIGQNFLNLASGYQIFSSSDGADYPPTPDAANGPGAVSLGTVELTSATPDRQGRLRFSFALPSTGDVYWVRPVFGSQLGAASNRLNLQVELKPETAILDAATGALLTGFSNNTLTFSASSPQLAALTPGSVIVSGPLDEAPSGFLLRVNEISGSGPVTITVEPADLRDALARASFSAYLPLRVEDVKSASSTWPGVEWDPQKTPSGQLGIPFFLPFDNVPVGSNATVSGNVLLWPSLVLNIELGPTVIDRLDFGASCELSGGITLEGDVGGSWGDDISLQTWNFTPIVFSLAGFPIVLEPSIDLILGSTGDCTLEFSASAGLDASLEGTIGYKDGNWGSHKSYGGQFSTPDPVIYGAVHSDTFTGARLNLLVYGLTGGTGSLTAGFKLDADVTANPWWTICAYVKGTLGVDLLLLTKDFELFDECLWKRDAGGPFVAPPAITSWAVTLDHDQTADYDTFNAVLPLSDGRVVAAGSSFLHPLVVLFDTLGDVVWQYEYSEPGQIHDLALSADGGIIAVGSHISDGLAMKITPDGALTWARNLGGPKTDVLYSVEPLAGGGFLAVGQYITDAASSEGWAVRLNEDGTTAASTSFGSDNGDEFFSLTRNPDGSFYAAGAYNNNDDAWLAKLDAGGNALWHKRVYISGKIPGTYDEWATGVASDGAGGCYLTGQTNRGALTMWVIRYDPGSHSWVRQIDHEDFAITWDVTDITSLRDGGMAICGQTGTAGPMGQRDGFVVCFSAGGGLNWAAAYGGSQDDGFFGICEKQGSAGLFAAGIAQSFRSDNEQDAWTLQLRPGGTVSFNGGKGAGRSYLAGNVVDDEDLTEHFVTITPHTGPATLSEDALAGSWAGFGAAPVEL